MSSKAASSTPFYLSVVAASRNDDHGGDPLIRTQIFISNFARQCEKYGLAAELILVDWNPVPGRPGLAGVLQLPPDASSCHVRIITVPAVLHERLKYSDRVAFFQMIAKNAGIRRARGRFILATNIDIIFSDELIRYIAQQRLDPTKLFRVDRYDIQPGLTTDTGLQVALDYAWSHPVRSNHRFEPRALVDHLYGQEVFKRVCQPDPEFCRTLPEVTVKNEGDVWSVRPRRDVPLGMLHTNACGDFTLLSREGWAALTGYPEFEAFSFHIDSFGLAAAHYGGFEEVALLPPLVCFHIEHSLGSGWTPEGEKKLFERLAQKEILNPEWHILMPMVEAMRQGNQPVALNGPTWGLQDFELPEYLLLPEKITSTPVQPAPFDAPGGLAVSALLPAYDLDRVSLWQDRRQTPTERLNQTIEELRTNLKQTVVYLGQVDQDRTDRLAALQQYEADMKQTVAYLRTVEKDSADRLASIHFYQEKLKQAYADHDHNVGYIAKIHAEIEAHVKVSAEKDAIIARLNEQLRTAMESRPAGS